MTILNFSSLDNVRMQLWVGGWVCACVCVCEKEKKKIHVRVIVDLCFIVVFNPFTAMMSFQNYE